MTMQEVIKTIKQHGGTLGNGINWTWAHFKEEAPCKECFAKVQAHIEHRGIYAPRNGMAEDWAFRFR